MHDGTEVYIEVTRPADDAGQPLDGQWPVILEASPYHGTLADREGMRILPDPRDENGTSLGLTGYFVPKGYAVVMMDLRGTGKSDGCLDHLGANDAQDLEDVVEWAASQSWSNGRVGMTGHSYVGSTPSLAAAMDPEGLVTIVPSAGMATMYDHQFQAGVPYFLQWAGPMEAYEQIALERDLPDGEHFGEKPEETGCGLPNSSLTAGEAQLSGQYTSWHAERDWREAATAADIPVFMVHGVNDNAARVAGIEWFTDRGGRAGDKIVARPVGPRLRLLPQPARHPVDLRAARLVRPPPRPARRRDRPRLRAVPLRRHLRGRPHRRPQPDPARQPVAAERRAEPHAPPGRATAAWGRRRRRCRAR